MTTKERIENARQNAAGFQYAYPHHAALSRAIFLLSDVAEAAEEVAQRLKVSCPFCEDDPEAEPDLHKDDCPMYLLNSALAKLAEAGDA